MSNQCGTILGTRSSNTNSTSNNTINTQVNLCFGQPPSRGSQKISSLRPSSPSPAPTSSDPSFARTLRKAEAVRARASRAHDRILNTPTPAEWFSGKAWNRNPVSPNPLEPPSLNVAHQHIRMIRGKRNRAREVHPPDAPYMKPESCFGDSSDEEVVVPHSTIRKEAKEAECSLTQSRVNETTRESRMKRLRESLYLIWKALFQQRLQNSEAEGRLEILN